MLRIDLRALSEGSGRTDAVIPADDPLFADLAFRLAAPVAVSGRITASGAARYYWRGRIESAVAASCRRCLADVPLAVAHDVSLLFTDDASVADDPATYLLAPPAVEVDLAEAVREQLILAVPDYVLCRPDCLGLCPRCGAELNQGPCACRPEADPRWAVLEALKGRGDANEDT